MSEPSQFVGKPTCGIVMPISDWDSCPRSHWANVLKIVTDALEERFDVKMVSENDELTILQQNIVSNLYENKIVVCDVSGGNPNVMFELGMRIAFNQPVVIIKDDSPQKSFDIQPLEYIPYVRSLHHPSIEDFKSKLLDRTLSTLEKKEANPEFSQYLDQFVIYVKKPLFKKVEETDLDEIIRQLRELLANQNRNLNRTSKGSFLFARIADSLVDLIVQRFPQLEKIGRSLKSDEECPLPDTQFVSLCYVIAINDCIPLQLRRLFRDLYLEIVESKEFKSIYSKTYPQATIEQIRRIDFSSE